MKTNEIKESICMLVNSCTRTLMHQLMDPKGSSLAGYFKVTSREEELRIAKCVSIYFHKAWYTEPHDFDVMANGFEQILKGLNADEESFLNSIISVALDLEDPSSWDEDTYPMMMFRGFDHTKPYNVKIVLGNQDNQNEDKNDERS